MPKAKVSNRILIVEDDSAICAMYKAKLAADGFDVAEAGDGVTAVEMAAKEKFDLILLDIILPMMDGFAVLENLIKKDKKVRVIMLTNLGTDEDKEKAKTIGALDYIVKASVTPGQLSEKVKTYFK